MIKRCLLEVAENMENVKIQFVIFSDTYMVFHNTMFLR